MQYDQGQRRSDGRFMRTGLLNTPVAVQKLKSGHHRGIKKFTEYLDELCTKEGLQFQCPAREKDLLFRAEYNHVANMIARTAVHMVCGSKKQFSKRTIDLVDEEEENRLV